MLPTPKQQYPHIQILLLKEVLRQAERVKIPTRRTQQILFSMGCHMTLVREVTRIRMNQAELQRINSQGRVM